MIEKEYKFFIEKDCFYSLYDRVKSVCPPSNAHEKFQINYYYDDNYLSLNRSGITVRARQSGDALTLEIKRHGDGSSGYYISEESEQPVFSLPARIHHSKLGEISLRGSLITCRRRFIIRPGLFLDFDENFYLGHCDYEIELEFEEGRQAQAEEVLSALGLLSYAAKSKSARFFDALERICVYEL